MKLLKKLLELQDEVSGLKKDKKGHNYSYLSGEKILKHIKPKMIEKKLLLKQEVIDSEDRLIEYEAWDKYDKVMKKKYEILTMLDLRFTWICTESNEREEILFKANGQNNFDKGVGSALTYGERYFLMKFFHLETDQDDVDNVSKQRELSETTIPDDVLNPILIDLEDVKTKDELNALYKKNLKHIKAHVTLMAYFDEKNKQL